MPTNVQHFPYFLAELPANHCCAIVANLVVDCAWFQYMPLPHDQGRIIVKNETGPTAVVRRFSPSHSTYLTQQQYQTITPA